MTTDILVKTASGVLNATGNATVTLSPDIGQNWAPLFIRVSTVNRATPVPYCAYYVGSPGVPPQQSQFIDDTFLGNGDTSSMISGTPVRFGEAVLVTFTKGNPGDTAIVTLYGMTSDLPPNLGINPQVPGTHFSGKPSPEIDVVVVTTPPGTPIEMFPGTTTTINPVDMRSFQSFYFLIGSSAVGAATAYNPLLVTFDWFADPLGISDPVFRDEFEIWSDNINTPFFAAPGVATLEDVCHGSYLRVRIFNGAATDHIDIQFTLIGTTRQLPGPYLRQQLGTDGVLIEDQTIIGPGGINTYPLPVTYGTTYMKFFNNGAAAMTLFLGFGSNAGGVGATNDFVDTVPATTSRIEPTVGGVTPAQAFIFPKRAGIIRIQGTVGQNYGIRVITLFNKV